tara:strand:- start:2065 stop:2754 length:690 start_codon:yes stop_codon:yes gene_type:complete
VKNIICLCDYTGIFGKPWANAGYQVILVDPQHEPGVHRDGMYIRVGGYIDEVTDYISSVLYERQTVLVAGFPPCTDVAVAGAAHWANKLKKDRYFQCRATAIAQSCKTIGQLSQVPWFFENPVSGFSSIFGKPQHIFNPYEYGGYLAEDDEHPLWPKYIKAQDAYPKKTCLWSGNGFDMPKKKPVSIAPSYSDQYTKLGGKSLKTKNIRSATPRGFAQAIFEKYGENNG